jgi:hypothetical protein
MNLYKLRIFGTDGEFSVQYSFSSDFITFKECAFQGSEQEKYRQFQDDLQKFGGPQPVNFKMKMANKSVDRAVAKAKILAIKDIKELIDFLGK